MSRKLNVVEALLQCNFDPNAIEGTGSAPIHDLGRLDYRASTYSSDGRSIRPGYKRTLSQVLLNHGTEPYLKDQYGFMSLWIASYAGREHEIDTLLRRGVDPDGLDIQVGEGPPGLPQKGLNRAASRPRPNRGR